MKDNFNIFKTSAFEVKLAKDQAPIIKKDLSSGLIKIGKKNDYPTYLLFLYNNHPEHGGIVRGKAKYITGLDIKPKSGNQLAYDFLKKANPKESWLQVRRKTDKDKVIFGGFYLKIHTNALGIPVWAEHINWASVRKLEDGRFVICDDFKNYQTAKKTFLPAFCEGRIGTSVYEWKSYTPVENEVQSTYPQTEYTSGILDIDTDIRVGTYFNSIVKNNFSAGTIITVFNGETDPKRKEEIVKRIKGEYEGEDEAGKTTVVFVGKDGKPTEVTRLNANDLDKQYKEVNLRNIQKIVAAHNVPAELFKIRLQTNSLINNQQLAEMHELFINEYALPEQAAFNDVVAYFYKLRTGNVEEFETEQIKLIGNQLPLDNQNVINALNQKDPNIFINYIIDKYNLEIPKTEVSSLPKTQANANESITNLSGRQFQNLMRIVNKYEKGLINKDAALMMLKSGFKLTDDEALTFLNAVDDNQKDIEMEVKQSADKEHLFFEVLAKYKHKRVNDIILDEYEVKNKTFQLAEGEPTDDIKNSILEQLKGNPFATPEDLSKQLDIPLDVIKLALDWLLVKKLIEANEGVGFTPTEKAMDLEGGNTVEIYTEYTYELRPDAPRTNGGKLIKSRDFCKKLMSQFGDSEDAITYEAITKMRNEFGDNVWDFRGGFYTNGNTGETTPWCRHYWKATVKARKKNK